MDHLERTLLPDLLLCRDDDPAYEPGRVVDVLVLQTKYTLYPLEREMQRLAGIAQDLEKTDTIPGFWFTVTLSRRWKDAN